jgi:hypothetical protein
MLFDTDITGSSTDTGRVMIVGDVTLRDLRKVPSVCAPVALKLLLQGPANDAVAGHGAAPLRCRQLYTNRAEDYA